MTEKNTKAFVHEEIREMPLNKKRLFKRLMEAAASGAAFAIAACCVFALFGQVFLKGEGKYSLQEAEMTESEEGTETASEISETESVEIQEETQKEEVLPVQVSLTIEDYQKLQNELYSIGNKVNYSIVGISSISNSSDWFNNSYQTETDGSGVIISKGDNEILILTETTSLTNPDNITVYFHNEAYAPAQMKGYDPNTGIAVISVKVGDLDSATANIVKAAEMGNSKTVRRGQITIALGSPLGSCYSILAGNITSLDNQLPLLDHNFGLLSTDIFTNDAGSGVLVDTNGAIIGLIMQKYNNSEQQSTLTAFAISEVQQLIELLKAGRQIPYMGISGVTVTNRIARTYNIPQGVYIREVQMDSPAMNAVLQSGDVITAVGQTSVYNTGAVYEELLKHKPGDRCEITLQRANGDSYSEVKCTITLGEMNQ